MNISYQKNSLMNDFYSSNNHQNYDNQQKIQQKTVSNRDKIFNLHQKIKMLNQVENNQIDKRVNPYLYLDNQKLNYSETSQIHKDKLMKVKSEKTFLNRSLSQKRIQNQANYYQKLQEKNPLFKTTIQTSLQKQFTLSNSSHLQCQPTFNNQHNKQHNESDSCLPYFQNHKPQPFENQNISNFCYKSNSQNDLLPLEGKYLSIQDKYLQFKMSQETLLKNIQNQINDLYQSYKQMKKQNQRIQKRNEEIIDNIQKSISDEINELSSELKDVKKGAIQSLDIKHKAIRFQTIAMMTEEFQSKCKLSSTQLQTELDSVQRSLQKQQNLRDETSQFLISSFGDEIIKLEQVFNIERQSRIRKNDDLLKLINCVEDQLMDKIQRQKREMAETIENMENMLEQVCYKIQQKILGV